MSAPVPATAPAAAAHGAPAAELLTVRDIEVGYGDASLSLRGVSLSVPAGSAVALLGANGAGKTTTIRAITGMLRPHRGAVRAGEIAFEGESLRRLRPDQIVARGIAQVPEGRMLFANLSVEENLLTGASHRGRADLADSLAAIYDLFPVLRERRRQRAGWMSGGEQQMIAIGRALMAGPRVLLVDELSLGLAPLITRGIIEQLRSARRELGMATLMVEQNARVALDFCDYAYILENGRIVLEGPSAVLRDDPQVQEAYLAVGRRDDAAAAGRRGRTWWP
jgi:branched-chain amino acid transport system ATP-binding protein